MQVLLSLIVYCVHAFVVCDCCICKFVLCLTLEQCFCCHLGLATVKKEILISVRFYLVEGRMYMLKFSSGY